MQYAGQLLWLLLMRPVSHPFTCTHTVTHTHTHTCRAMHLSGTVLTWCIPALFQFYRATRLSELLAENAAFHAELARQQELSHELEERVAFAEQAAAESARKAGQAIQTLKQFMREGGGGCSLLQTIFKYGISKEEKKGRCVSSEGWADSPNTTAGYEGGRR